MKALPISMFELLALALPWGLSFVDHYPYQGCAEEEGWISNDGATWGVVCYSPEANTYSSLVVRRRIDLVWTVIYGVGGFALFEEAKAQITSRLEEGRALEPLPPSTPRRQHLFAGASEDAGSLFRLLRRKSKAQTAWVLGHLYLSMPKPDQNFVTDFRSSNFHTRLWELLLLASFREQGCFVSQDHPSPDFHIRRRSGDGAWIEAVTANPPDADRYDHVDSPLAPIPNDPRDRCMGGAAVRFHKTLRRKIDRRYDQYSHVQGQPFAIALADFHAPGSMMWSREALITYLYGEYAEVQNLDGVQAAVSVAVQALLDNEGTPAGLFRSGKNDGLSAIVFSNGCTIAKFGRVMQTMSGIDYGFTRTRVGMIFDRTPGVLEGIPFCLDVSSREYQELWPQRYEPWSAELEIFHNPFATYPFPKNVLPEAQHWFRRDGSIVCEAFYETSVLWSETRVTNKN